MFPLVALALIGCEGGKGTDDTGDIADTADTGHLAETSLKACLDAAADQGVRTVYVVNEMAVDRADGTCVAYHASSYESDNDCSLRDAVIAANASFGDTFVCVPPGRVTLELEGTDEDASLTGDLDVGNDRSFDSDSIRVTVMGAGADQTIIDANNTDRAFHVVNEATLSLSSLGITQGMVVDNGGAIYSDGNLSLSDVVVMNSTAEGDGGAVYSDYGSTLSIQNSSFEDNQAVRDGGAVYGGFNMQSIDIDNVSFSRNTTLEGQGGALYLGEPTTVTNSIFTENSSLDGYGGAISTSDELTLQETVFTGNSSLRGYGGAIYTYDPLTIEGGSFEGNWAERTEEGDDPSGNGGAISGDEVDIDGVTFTDNWSYQGGALDISGGTIRNSTFTSNAAYLGEWSGEGGAIHGQTFDSLSFYNNVFEANTAEGEGGAASISAEEFTIDLCTFTGNTTTGPEAEGGALFLGADNTTITNSNFSGNTSAGNGGGISSFATHLIEITDSSFEGNTSLGNGGGVYSYADEFLVQATTFKGNQATNGGGGIFVQDSNPTTFSIQDSAFTSNLTNGDGGALYINLSTGQVGSSTFQENGAEHCGGGYYNDASVVNLLNTTWYANDHAAICNDSDVTDGSDIIEGNLSIDSSTFAANNGGAVNNKLSANSVTVKNNLFSDNPRSGVDTACVGNKVISEGFNTDSGTACTALSDPDDQTGTDPQLDPAGPTNNGGITDTIEVTSASAPGVDSGSGTTISGDDLDVDQNGRARPVGAGYDRGASESY